MTARRPRLPLLLAASLVAASTAASGGETDAPFGERPSKGSALTHPHPATAAIRFRDVAEDCLSVLDGMTDAEQADVRRLIQEGSDLSAKVKTVRRSDHAARTEAARGLEDLTRQLQALHAKGLSDRTTGRHFIPAWNAASGWLQVGEEHAGLKILRVSFDKPGNAWIIMENPGASPRPFGVTIAFSDRVGETTGEAAAYSGPLEELKPGEIRRVLAPIIPAHPGFWDATTGFSISAK